MIHLTVKSEHWRQCSWVWLLQCLLFILLPPSVVLAEDASLELGRIYFDVPADVTDESFWKKLSNLKDNLPLKVGEEYTLGKVQASIRTLYQLGLFSRIKAFVEPLEEGRSVSVRLELLPTQVVDGVIFEGNSALDDRDLKRVMHLREGDKLYDEDLVDETIRIKTLYRRHGFPFATIGAGRVPTPAPYRSKIRFRISENSPLIVSNIDFSGDLFFPKKELARKFPLRSGDRMDRDLISRHIDVLNDYYWDQGFYEARIRLEDDEQEHPVSNSAPARINIQAGHHISMRFIGNRHYSRRELMEVLNIERNQIFSFGYGTLIKLKQSLTEFYIRRGYLHVAIQIKEKLVNRRRKVISFMVHEGKRVKLSRVSFEGLNAFESDDLEDELLAFIRDRLATEDEDGLKPPEKDALGRNVYRFENGARDYGAWSGPAYDRPPELATDEVYIPAEFEDGARALEQFYREHGYLSCRIPPPRKVFNGTGQRLELVYRLDEGIQTLVRHVSVTGAGVKSEQEILDLAGIRPAEALNDLAFEEIDQRLRDKYTEEGYIYAKIRLSYQLSPNGKLADVRIALDEGRQVHVGRILVNGLNKTDVGTVIEELTFEQGDVYRPKEMEESQRWLQKLGIFQAVTLKPWDPEQEEPIKNVVVKAIERPPGRFEISGGIATDDGIRMGSLFIYRNLLGRALEFHLNAKINHRIPALLDSQFADLYGDLSFYDSLERKITLGIYYPSIKGSHIGLRTDLIHLRKQERSYGLDSNSFLLAFDTELWRYLTIAQINVFSFNDSQHTTLTPLSAREEESTPPAGQTWEISPKLQLVFDYRDSVFSPTKGVVISGLLEYFETLAGELNVDLFRWSSSIAGYIPIPIMRRPPVLKLALRVGSIARLSSVQTPVEKRFKLGGRTSLRGFGEDAVYPADLTIAEKALVLNADVPSYGGNAFMLMKADLRIPVYKSYFAGAFFDMGSLWNDPRNMDLRVDRYKMSSGAGVHYRTPVGDISLEMGWNLNRNRSLNEDSWRLHFSINLF